ncbi:hypothetical protein [Kamptonema sp. UHCC 0994]|uniref:hypothetical protein n=1 Tax=Kamptonema sp. UHCC 0994 TaxID=3031329 RepID=UPI0023BA17B7|nr:hypothetical protein [Kamptonema sp. UHCC 0994]MDF0552196.1 hypothetical protein [Kamptonema sp. UHCC 0994]
MIDRIVITTWGGIAGISVGVIVIFAQLQSSYYATLLTICGVSGAAGANASYAIGKRKKGIGNPEIERAIGVISERYALERNSQKVLVALEEFKEELRNGN